MSRDLQVKTRVYGQSNLSCAAYPFNYLTNPLFSCIHWYILPCYTGRKKVPLISEFFGIKIYMYWDEHIPPHFHAEYGGTTILVDIINGVVLRGTFPLRQLKLVLAWCELHRDELMGNWNSASAYGEMKQIDPIK